MANPSHTKSTMAQKEYVKAIVHQLSLQRFSDPEMVEFLAEKGIVISRSRVNQIKTQIEKQAEKWYIDLKQSRYKYIATYKERLDSLLCYQKILHDMISTTKKEEIKIRAISELTSIEMNIFSLWKQLPNLDITTTTKQQEQDQEPEEDPPILSIEDINGVEELPDEVKGTWHNWEFCHHCKRWWSSHELLQYHKKRSSDNACAIPNVVEVTSTSNTISTSTSTTTEPQISTKTVQNDDEGQGDGQGEGEWKQLQCPACNKWFMNNFTLSAHKCTA